MEGRKSKRTVSPKVNNKKTLVNQKSVKGKTKTKKMKIKPIIIVDYTFLVSLVFSIIFGMQTNPLFLLPFTITLVFTLVSMGIILVNAIYTKIKTKFSKKEKNHI